MRLSVGTLLVGALSLSSALGFELTPYYLQDRKITVPEIASDNPKVDALIKNAWQTAFDVMLNINTLCRRGHLYFTAGGEYGNAWTRDGSFNSGFAGTYYAPEVAEGTLRLLVADGMVNGAIGDGDFNDMQFWDKQLWIVAAWRHYLMTGDEDFLRFSMPIALKTLKWQEDHYYQKDLGVFRGPGFILDSIGALPREYCPMKDGLSSCVVDYPDAVQVMSLSSNAIYVPAYRAAAKMVRAVGGSADVALALEEKASALVSAIRRRFFEGSPDGVPAYFLHGKASRRGERAWYQEGAGLGFALLAGIPDEAQAKRLMEAVHLEPRGLPMIWPSLRNDYLGSGFYGSTDDGYQTPQNITIWPQVNGVWMLGCSAYGRADLFGSELLNLCRLIRDQGGIWEIYHARTGHPKLWGHPAKKHQNWGAAAVIASVTEGLFGIRADEQGLAFRPCLPKGFGVVSMRGFRYRAATIDLTVRGGGCRVKACTVDGRASVPRVGRMATGRVVVELEVE